MILIELCAHQLAKQLMRLASRVHCWCFDLRKGQLIGDLETSYSLSLAFGCTLQIVVSLCNIAIQQRNAINMNQPFGFCGFPMRRCTDLILMWLMLVFGGKFVCPNWSTGSNREKCLFFWVDLRMYLGWLFLWCLHLLVSLCVFSVRFDCSSHYEKGLEGFWQLTDMLLQALRAQTILWESLRISLHTMMTTMLMTTMIFMIMTISMLMTRTIICLPWRFLARQHMLRRLAETSWSSLCFRKHETGVQFHGYVSIAGEGVKIEISNFGGRGDV